VASTNTVDKGRKADQTDYMSIEREMFWSKTYFLWKLWLAEIVG
jgi:hypothetical protein